MGAWFCPKRSRMDYGLIYACIKGYTRVVQLLLAVPRVSPVLPSRWFGLESVLLFAVENGNVEVLKMLLAHPLLVPASSCSELRRKCKRNLPRTAIKANIYTVQRIVASMPRYLTMLALRARCQVIGHFG